MLKKHNTAFVVLESETYAEAVLRNNVPSPAAVEAQRFNQRPRDPIKVVSKRLTKMYKGCCILMSIVIGDCGPGSIFILEVFTKRK